MGCDIHSYAERKTAGGYKLASDWAPFDWRDYGMYAFLADVRNYSDVPPISKPRGLPTDASAAVLDANESWSSDGHTHSWLSVAELAAFDYDAAVADCRVTRQIGPRLFSGGETCSREEGRQTTYREFLGPHFFADLARLQAEQAERVVFWFDN